MERNLISVNSGSLWSHCGINCLHSLLDMALDISNVITLLLLVIIFLNNKS